MPPITVDQAIQLALTHHGAGRLVEAEKIYRQILVQHPNHHTALHLLGEIAMQVGRGDLAVEWIAKAIALCPGESQYHVGLGSALLGQRQFDRAIASFRRALELKPDSCHAWNNLGLAMKESGRLDDAIAAYEQALRFNANFPEACNNLGVALALKGEPDKAIAALRQSLRLRPDNVETQINLASALAEKQQYDEAVSIYRNALRLNPSHADAWYNLGISLGELRQSADALHAYDQATRLRPDWAEPRYNAAQIRLLHGDYPRGWEGYEWRWKSSQFESPRRNFAQPQWDGRALGGKTILLHGEQGAGDTIQFIRYAPLVAARGGRVLLLCPPELARLLRDAPGVAQVVSPDALPYFDVHCPLLSLPLTVGTRIETIPPAPYLAADVESSRAWREKITSPENKLRIGLAWAGNPRQKDDRRRSLALEQMAPLGKVTGVTFFRLQKGDAAKQATNPPAGMQMLDFTSQLHDFADTAALISHLDLVITPCTAVAHLAGAMGKPVWVLLSARADWRWLLDRDDSPWYPSARLFRQKKLGDWADVIERVASALNNLARVGAINGSCFEGAEQPHGGSA